MRVNLIDSSITMHTLNRDGAIHTIDYQLFVAILRLNYEFVMQTISTNLGKQKHKIILSHK